MQGHGVPSLHQDPKDAGFQVFQAFMVPGLTHEAAPHVKQRKMQTNKTTYNNTQTKSASFVMAYGKVPARLPARNSCKGSSKGFLL